MTQHENNIINDYLGGYTFDRLIKKYKHKFNTIKKILTDNNIKIRDKSEAVKRGKNKTILTEAEQEAIEEYNNSANGLKVCANKYGFGCKHMKSILNNNNYHIRSQKEATSNRNKNKRKYYCDENFFKHQSHEMAYILGFIAADGTVGLKNNQIKITLSEKDKEILLKIKKELKYTGDIKTATTSKGFKICSLAITCEQYKKDLSYFNIVPQKTFTFTLPSTIKHEFIIDFIRGYFDGDGSIGMSGKYARAQLCSANQLFLEQVLNFLYLEFNIAKPKIYCRKNENAHDLYYFQYNSKLTKILYNYLYYPNCLCLERKYEIFKNICS